MNDTLKTPNKMAGTEQALKNGRCLQQSGIFLLRNKHLSALRGNKNSLFVQRKSLGYRAFQTQLMRGSNNIADSGMSLSLHFSAFLFSELVHALGDLLHIVIPTSSKLPSTVRSPQGGGTPPSNCCGKGPELSLLGSS